MKKEYESPEIDIVLLDFSSAVCANLNDSRVGFEEDEDFGDDFGNDT